MIYMTLIIALYTVVLAAGIYQECHANDAA